MNCVAGHVQLVGCTSTSAQEPLAYTRSCKKASLDPSDVPRSHMALGTYSQIQVDISSGTYYLGLGTTLTGLLTGQVSGSRLTTSIQPSGSAAPVCIYVPKPMC